MVDEAGAVWVPTTHQWAGRGGHTPRWIIVHGTASPGPATAIAHWFQSNDPPTSTHYLVDRDGTVVQCVAERDAAWGNGILSAGHAPWWSNALNPNWVTISIEHVKPHSDNSDVLTPAQQAASFRLIEHICARWAIPRRPADAQGGITGHFSIDPVGRAHCPGPYPWDALWAALNLPAPKENPIMLLPGVLWRETEFWRRNNVWLTALCGPNALAAAQSWSLQRYVPTLAIFDRMRAAPGGPLCGPTGASTAWALWQQAIRDGFTCAYLGYREPMPEATWRGFLTQYAGTRALVVEVANGQALRDAVSGLGENGVGVQYHSLMIAGRHTGGVDPRPRAAGGTGKVLPAGWWACDGDNWAVGNVLQLYPDAVLAAARPCAAIAVAARVPMLSTGGDGSGAGSSSGAGGSASMGGYTDLGGGKLRCNRTGVVLEHAQAAYVARHPEVGDALQAEQYVGSTHGFVPYSTNAADGEAGGDVLVWDTVRGTLRRDFAGPMLKLVCEAWQQDAARLRAAQAESTALRTQAAAKDQELATLRQQVQALQQQLAAAATNASSSGGGASTVTPAHMAALAAVVAMGEALDAAHATHAAHAATAAAPGANA